MDVRRRHRDRWRGCDRARLLRSAPGVFFFFFFLFFLAHFSSAAASRRRRHDASVRCFRFRNAAVETCLRDELSSCTRRKSERDGETQRKRERARERRERLLVSAQRTVQRLGRPTAQKRRRQQDERAQTNVAIVQLTTASWRTNERERNRPGGRRFDDLRVRS